MNTLFDYAKTYPTMPDLLDDIPFLANTLVGNPIGFFKYIQFNERTTIWKCMANIRQYFGPKHYAAALGILREGEGCKALADFKAAFDAAPQVKYRVLLLDSFKDTDESPSYDGVEESFDVTTDLLDSKFFYRPGNDIIVLSPSPAAFQAVGAVTTSPPDYSNSPELMDSLCVYDASVTTRDSFKSFIDVTLRKPMRNVENRTKFVYITQKNLLFLRRAIADKNPAYTNMFDRVVSTVEDLSK